MADAVEKEYCTGEWNGDDVRFNRVFRGHRFTDQECVDLLAGKEIEVHGLTAKSGNTYGVYGKLANLSFTNDNGEEIPYVGFEQLGFCSKDVPAIFCQHKFTDDEINALESGCEIFVEELIGKSGKKFNAYLTWGDDPDNPRSKRINMRFDS